MSINNLMVKKKAVEMRRNGRTYSEILKIIPVAKSTLSLWLKDVGLSQSQSQKISKKRVDAARKGGDRRRMQRVLETEKIQHEARESIGKISERELFLIGVALYWAEGSKQKENLVSAGVTFSNSDVEMVVVFLKWLEMLRIHPDRIIFELYIHVSAKEKVPEIQHYWSKMLNSSINKFSCVYFKKGNGKTNRRNIGREYHGLIRIKVSKSTDFNRRIAGWVMGICESK